MNKALIGIGALAGVGCLLTVCIKETRRKGMKREDSRFVVPDFESAIVVNKDDPKTPMDNIEREALVEVVKAMDDEEIDIFLDNIPINRIIKRIERELEKHRLFKETIEGAMPFVNK